MSTQKERDRAASLRYFSQRLANPQPITPGINVFGASFDGLTAAQRELDAAYEMAQSYSPEMVVRVSQLVKQNPMAQAGTLLGLAKAGIGVEAMSDPSIKGLLEMDSVEQARKEWEAGPGPETPAGNDAWFGLTNDWFGPFKFVTRNLLEGAYAPYQALEGAWRGAVGAIGEEGGPDYQKAALSLASFNPALAKIGDAVYGDDEFQNAWEQTNAGQSIISMMAGDQVDQGDGWFAYGLDSAVIDAQRAATFDAGRVMWKKDGRQESWTLGRGLASVIIEDGEDTSAKVMSGVIDAAAMLFLDPALMAGKAAAAFKGARNVSRLREVVNDLEGARSSLAEARAAGEAIDEAAGARLIELENRISTLQAEEAALLADYKSLGKAERKAAREIEKERRKIMESRESLEAARLAERDYILDGNLAVALANDLDGAYGARDAARDTFQEAQDAVARTQRWGKTEPLTEEWNAAIGVVAERYGGPLGLDEVYATAEETASVLGKWMGGGVTNDLPPRAGGSNQWEDISAPAIFGQGEGLHSLPTGRKPRVVNQSAKINNSLKVRKAITEEVPGEVTQRVVREGRDEWPAPSSPSYADDMGEILDDLAVRAREGDEAAGELRSLFLDEREVALQNFIDHLDETNPTLAQAYLEGNAQAVKAVEDIFEQSVDDWVGGVREIREIPSPEAAGLGRLVEDVVGESTTRTVREAEDTKALFTERLIKATLGGKNPSQRRQEIAQGFAVMLNDASTTWGDILNFAADFDVTRPLALALSQSGIDGVGGVRAARGLEESVHGPGYWWTNLGDSIVADTAGAFGGANAVVARRIAAPTVQEAKAAYREANRAARTAETMYRTEGARQAALWRATARAERVGTRSRARYAEQVTERAELADQIDAMGLTLAERTEMLAHLTDQAEVLRLAAGKHVSANWATTYDWSKARDFLFGSRWGNKVMEHFVETTDTAALYRLTSGKLPHEAYTALAAAKTEAEVFAVLTPYIGKELTQGFSGIKAIAANAPIPMSVKDKGSRLWGRWASIVPKGVKIQFKDPEDATFQLLNYARYLGMTVEQQDNILRAALAVNEESAFRNVVIGTFKQFNETLVDQVSNAAGMTAASRQKMLNAVNESVIVYERGRVQQETYLAKMLGEDAAPEFQLVNGERVRLPNAELDAEFASGGVILPDPAELRRASSMAGRLIAGNPGSRAASYLATAILGTAWRTLALAFRPAFIIRNIGEEQVRMFLNGGPSIFTHPIGVISMAMSMNQGSKAAQRLRRDFNSYMSKQMDEYVTGKPMKIRPEDEDSIYELADEFTEAISHMYSPLRPNEYRQGVAATQVFLVRPTEGQVFRKGWAHELMLLRQSKLGRMVHGDEESYPAIKALADEMDGDWDSAVVQYLQSHPDGIAYVDTVAQSSPEIAAVLRDPMAATEYLFGEGVQSVRGRGLYLAGGDAAITDFFRTGRLVDDDGTLRFDMNQLWRKQGIKGDPVEQRHVFFANQLEPVVARLAPEIQESLLVRGSRTSDAGRSQNGALERINAAVDKFFDVSAKMERAASFGIEYRHTYWDYIGKYAEFLTPEAKAQALEVALRTIPKNRVAKAAGHLSWQDRLFQNLESGKTGPVGIDEIQELASKHAGEHVKSLFYNSTNEKAYWHSLRLVFPFGQAFANSLAKWTTLAARNPVRVYQFSALHRSLMAPGSNTLYAVQNALMPGDDLNYDQSQGFFWTDPNDPDKERRFWYPKALTAPIGLFGKSDETPQFAAQMSSLNLLGGGGMVLPGLGPLASFGATVTGLDERDNALADFVNKWANPFGEPDYEAGVVETLMPAWMRKVYQGVMPGTDQARMSATKQAATYLASQADRYNGALTPGDQDALIADANWLSRAVMFVTGVGAGILPASPKSEWFIRNNQDGQAEMIGTVAGNYFNDAAEMGTDAAQANLMNQYGVAGIYAIVSINTPTSERLSDNGLDWYKANPEAARAIGIDRFGVFFPGDSSPAVVAWQEKVGIRDRMTSDQWGNEVTAFLYRLQAANITRIAEEQGLEDEERRTLKAMLDEEFGGRPESKFGLRSRDALLGSIRVGLSRPEIMALPQGQEAAEAVALYDGALAAARARNGDGLKAEANQDIVDLLVQQLVDLDNRSVARVRAQGGSTVIGVTDVLRSLMEED